MVATIAEYRYLAESLASHFGSLYRKFTGDGHLFLFESADAATRFGLKLISAWQDCDRRDDGRQMALRVGCHFGECMQMDDGTDWIGRAINLAKRVEDSAEANMMYVTESVLELVDLPLYEFSEVGSHALQGDHLPRRSLYRVASFQQDALDSRADGDLDAEAWFLKGVALIGTERENSLVEAACYEEALRLRADYAEAHNNLAVLLRKTGEVVGAAEHYREALRLRAWYPEAHYNYAILLEDGGSTAGAATHYAEALRLRPEYVDAHHAYANLLNASGELAGSDKHYREALRLRPNHAEVHNNYAIALEDRGDREGAASHYVQALAIRPAYPEAHYNYALFLEGQDDSEAAERHYREAIGLWPSYAEAHNNLAILLQTKGDAAGAREHYQQALHLRPNDPETHYNYALLMKRSGDDSAARDHFRIAAELAPDEQRFRSTTDRPA